MADENPHARYRFPANAKGFLFPPAAWIIYFGLSYSLQAVGCASAWDPATLNPALAALTGVTIVIIASVGIAAWRSWVSLRKVAGDEEENAPSRARFLVYAAGLNALLFVIATVWVGAAIPMLDPCQ